MKIVALDASPIHYRSGLYRLLAADPRLNFTVVYASRQGVIPASAGFDKPVVWDFDLLSGYKSVFLDRANSNPVGGGFKELHDIDIVSTLYRLQPEVLLVYGYNYITHQLAAYFQKVRNRPLLVREDQNLLGDRPIVRKMAKQIGLRLMLSQARGLYVGSNNRDWFRHYGVPVDRLYFAPYAVDNSRLRAEHRLLIPQVDSLKHGFGIRPDSGPVILSVNRLIPVKQPKLLLESFARVRTIQSCVLLIVGTGELEHEIRDLVFSESIPDVYFAGFLNQSKISEAYACADLFVLPSAHETWGLVVNEAMNFALPIIVSDKVGSGRDLVRNGENGYTFSSGNVNMLTSCLEALVKSAELRHSFGQTSLGIIDGWSHEVAAKGIVDAVRDSVGERRWSEAEAC